MNDDGKARAVHAEGLSAREAAPPHGEEVGSRAATAGPRSDASLNEFARTRLGTHLRAMYDAVAQQPVPDQFRDLIARLEAGEARDAEPSSKSTSDEMPEPDTNEAPGTGADRWGA